MAASGALLALLCMFNESFQDVVYGECWLRFVKRTGVARACQSRRSFGSGIEATARANPRRFVRDASGQNGNAERHTTSLTARTAAQLVIAPD